MAVDEQVAGDVRAMESMIERQIANAARAAGIALDNRSVAERRRRAEADRHVSMRPMPDVMAELRTLLAVRDGVAVWAVLSREADRLRAAGDQRSRQQIRRGVSPASSPSSFACGTRTAGPATATVGSVISTTWSATPMADGPRRPTGRVSARRATTPRRPMAGRPGRDPDLDTWSRRSRRPVIATPAPHPSGPCRSEGSPTRSTRGR
jgi:hypothetical protein